MIFYLITTFILYMWKEINHEHFFKHHALLFLFLTNMVLIGNPHNEYSWSLLCVICFIIMIRLLVDVGAIRYQELEKRKGRSGTLPEGTQSLFVWWQHRQNKIYSFTFILLVLSFIIYLLE